MEYMLRHRDLHERPGMRPRKCVAIWLFLLSNDILKWTAEFFSADVAGIGLRTLDVGFSVPIIRNASRIPTTTQLPVPFLGNF
jgi:hypothetical protein